MVSSAGWSKGVQDVGQVFMALQLLRVLNTAAGQDGERVENFPTSNCSKLLSKR